MESVTLLKRTQKIQKGIYALGAVKEKLLSPKEQNAPEKFIGSTPFQVSFKSFNRIKFKSYIIYGQNYSRMTKRDNSTVEYKSERNNRFGQVQFLIFYENETLAFVKTLECHSYEENANILIVTQSADDHIEVIRLQTIVSNGMFVSLSDGSRKGFVCRIPNRLESD